MASISTCLLSPSFPIRLKLPDKFHTLQTRPYITTFSKVPNFRVYASPVKASMDISTGIRPGGVVESDKLPSDVRKRAMEAVDACGGIVTIGDVACRAGLKLNEAQKALQALAADANGFLEVSDEGDVLYVFPKDYRSKLATKLLRIKIEPWIEKAKSAAEYHIRVSFGTALILLQLLLSIPPSLLYFQVEVRKIIVEDEADCLIQDLPFTLPLLIYFGIGTHITIGDAE